MALQFNHKAFGSLIGSGTYRFRHYGEEAILINIDLATYTESTDFSNVKLKSNSIIACSYTGSIKNVTLPAGTYFIECWGAKGGDAYSYTTSSALGGNGGYSVGYYTITSPQQLFTVSGGKGTNGTTTSGANAGGYNGGGNGCGYGYGGAGGGATHIATATGLLTARSSDYTSKLIMVAGGGGGGQYYSNSNYSSGKGGGTSGSDSIGYSTSYTAKGGTQSAGGEAGGYSSLKGNAGAFGQGGSAHTATSKYNLSGGGGGGLYGGGGGGYRSSSSAYYYGTSGGGGGSGYVNTSFLTNASTTQESTSTNPDSNKNGYIRIIVV